MASNGSFKTNGYQGRYLIFSWKQKSQNIAENTTTFTWELKGAGEGFYISRNFKVTIDGKVVFTKAEHSFYNDGLTVGTGEYTIKHQSNGKKSFSASASAAVYYSSTNVKGSGSWDLNTIPRHATITDAPNFSDEDTALIRYNNPAGNAATVLEASLTLDDSKTYIARYRDINKTGSSYKFTFTKTEQETMWNFCKDKTSIDVYFFIRSTIGGNTKTSKIKRTMSIVNANPTVSPSAEDKNPTTIAITQDKNTIVKNASTLGYSMSATAKKHATIKSYKVECGGSVLKTASGEFKNAPSGTVKFTVVDSRGFTASKTLDLKTINYVSPTVSVTSTVMDAKGYLEVRAAGRAFMGKIGSTSNSIVLTYRVKETTATDFSEAYGKVSPMYITIGDNYTYTAKFAIQSYPGTSTRLDHTKAYDVELTIADALNTVVGKVWNAVSTPIWAIGKNSFHVYAGIMTGPIFSLGPTRDENVIAGYLDSGEPNDLDLYTRPGVYAMAQYDVVDVVKHVPCSVPGVVVVLYTLGKERPDGTWNYISQLYIPRTTAFPPFYRVGNTNGSNPWVWNWTPWKTFTVTG